MAQLIDLQRRIKAIKSTKKVTHAMRLIAVSTYSKLKDKQQSFLKYKNSSEEIFSRLLKAQTKWRSNIIFPEDETNQNPLCIIISSSRGLCGPFHNNLAKHAKEKLRFRRHQKPVFITIGKRAQRIAEDIMKNRGQGSFVLKKHYESFNMENISKISAEITNEIFNAKASYSLVCTLSNTFKNLFAQIPKLNIVAPFKHSQQSNIIESENYIWEQDHNEILQQLIKNYVSSNIWNSILESILSENAARFVAMDSATNSAESHAETLSLQYNKMRQSIITREVLELSSSLIKSSQG
jgi:F-type H+-transporting ATPase subunit gamma